jgi:hypothetical protein
MSMRSRLHLLFVLPVLLALLLASCSLGGKPAGVSFQTSPDLLTDPTKGLADLQSYHVTFQQDVVGTLDGAPFERHTHIELTRLGEQVDFLRVIEGTQEASYYHTIQTDQAVYRWATESDSCDGQVGALREGEILEPASLLLLVLQTSKAGSEAVNGITATHYHFEQGGLAITEPRPAVSGDYWLAERAGFVVKYILQAASPANPTGTGVEASLSYAYELSQVNTIQSIDLPAGCQAVPLDLPVTADATNIHRNSGSVSYQTTSSAAQVSELYFQQLGVLGWIAVSTEPGSDVSLPLGLEFSQDELKLSINIDEYDAGSLDVDLLVYNPNELWSPTTSIITPVPATATPAGPLPTVDPAQAGLPADVPLYPGATGMQKFGTVVMFTVPDPSVQVTDWYREQMQTLGWSLVQEVNDNGQVVQVWQKNDSITSISINVEDVTTHVVIAWTEQ